MIAFGEDLLARLLYGFLVICSKSFVCWSNPCAFLILPPWIRGGCRMHFSTIVRIQVGRPFASWIRGGCCYTQVTRIRDWCT